MKVAEAQGAKPKTYPNNAIHTMRTAQLAQIQLSAMADHKASILMGATFVIFTIAIGQARSGAAPIPLLILGGAAFFSAICAVLAVLPAVKKRKTHAQPNILFFGNFSHMEEEAFIDELMGRLENEETFYRTMARDIYQAGCVLQFKKYRMLAWAYRIFLVGLVASCSAYVWIYIV